MNPGIAPINITVAALITQFSIMVIIFLGAIILKGVGYTPFYRRSPDPGGFSSPILLTFLLTMGLLGFSDQISDMWRPLFGNIPFPGVPWSISLLVMFIANIVLVTYMVYKTGGSGSSPFNAVFFMLPALAIFLRESGIRIVVYLVLIAICFWYALYNSALESGSVGSERRQLAYLVVSLLSFVLTTFIGYVTGPR